jgi:hypothetical protein
MMTRAEIPGRVSAVLGGRLARWRVGGGPAFDGVERSLEIFEVEARAQREALKTLRPVLAELEVAAGGPIVFIFFTPAQSARIRARSKGLIRPEIL